MKNPLSGLLIICLIGALNGCVTQKLSSFDYFIHCSHEQLLIDGCEYEPI